MLNRIQLVNIATFMERVTCTGKEALVWTETQQALVAEINAIDAADKLAADRRAKQHISPEIEA